MKTKHGILAGLLGGACLVAAGGCTAYVSEAPPERRDVVIVYRRGSPERAPVPVYVEARPVVYRYRYYPEAEAYYLEDRGTWFWYERNAWCSGRDVPVTLRVNLGSSVQIELAGDHPRAYHMDIRSRYPHHGGHGDERYDSHDRDHGHGDNGHGDGHGSDGNHAGHGHH